MGWRRFLGDARSFASEANEHAAARGEGASAEVATRPAAEGDVKPWEGSRDYTRYYTRYTRRWVQRGPAGVVKNAKTRGIPRVIGCKFFPESAVLPLHHSP